MKGEQGGVNTTIRLESVQTREEHYGELAKKKQRITSHCLHCWQYVIVITLLCWQIGPE